MPGLNEMEGLSASIKYIMFFIIYIVLTILFVYPKLELIVYFVYVIMNVLVYILLFMDIVASPKFFRPALIVIFSAMALILTSNMMLIILLFKINKTYPVAKQMPIQLQNDNKSKLDRYRSCLISANTLLFTWAAFFFALHKEAGDSMRYTPFFEDRLFSKERFGAEWQANPVLYLLKVALFFFKFAISVVLLALSGYMVYLMDFLTKKNNYREFIYREEKKTSPSTNTDRDGTGTSSVYYEPTMWSQTNNTWLDKITYPMLDMFHNLNLNYMTNSLSPPNP